ncbi:DUF2000 family protein [Zavarzinia sp.]|uniref:DUF2000 family protein n=1 Tax=Zavarzinia sp. TaxID=2027920 RepID=UPI00356397AD
MTETLPTDPDAAPVFDTKVALVLRDDLLAWQKLNIAAFLATGIAAAAPETLGLPYVDAAGRIYGRTLGQPMMIFAAEDALAPDLVGLALRGPRKAVDKAVKGLCLHS